MEKVIYYAFVIHQIRHMPQICVVRDGRVHNLCVVRDGKVSVNLLFSKSRNAPKKKLTIPRLELMSTLIGVRSLRFVANGMKLNDHEIIL